MNLYGYLMILSLILLGSSFFIGYPFCYFVVSPMLFKKYGKQSVWESFLNFYNIEKELKELAACVNDQAVFRTIKVISICKYSIIINLILFIVFSALNVNSLES